MLVIDAHHHLWDPTRAEYPWLGPDMGDLNRTVRFEELEPKLRAARGLWARIGRECGVTDSPQRQHAVSAESSYTHRDPWTNMLRGTLGCFGAGVGGADLRRDRSREGACLGDVEQRHVGAMAAGQSHRFLAAGGEQAAFDPGLPVEQRRQADPAGGVGVDHDRPHRGIWKRVEVQVRPSP